MPNSSQMAINGILPNQRTARHQGCRLFLRCAATHRDDHNSLLYDEQRALPGMVRQALTIAAFAARRFSALGLASVATLAVTAIYQGWLLSGGVAGLVRTAYGAVLLIKAVLFLVLVTLAAFNRVRLTPRLAALHGEQSSHAIIHNIRAETIIGLCVVLAASVLSSLEPGMHQV